MWQALFDWENFRKSCCFHCESLRGNSSKIGLLCRSLLGEKYGVDVWEDTSRRDGDTAEQLVQLLVVLDGKGDVTGHDASLLVIAGGVTGKLQNLSTEVLENGGEVDRGAGAHAGGVLSLAEVTADTADRELKSGLGRGGGALLLAATSFSFS
jgi:hypothetical protein